MPTQPTEDEPFKQLKKRSVWETSNTPNLLKNRDSGRYYARFVVSKKQRWVNLDTDDYGVAKVRAADERAKIERVRLASHNTASGVATFGEIAEILRARIRTDPTIG